MPIRRGVPYFVGGRIPRRSRGLRVERAVVMIMALVLTGCAAGTVGQSTRLNIDDFEAMTQAMAQSLLASETLAGRGPDSEPWVVSIDKVLNLSDDVMTTDEQWSIMAQVRGAASIRALWDEKAVRFVLPPERVVELRENPDATDFADGFGAERRVTHTMTATFRSVTRAQAKTRSDLYYCQFDMIDLTTGEPVWSDRFEFKRQAKGHVWD
jgi:Peptidoglycan-synthase activator LpoB